MNIEATATSPESSQWDQLMARYEQSERAWPDPEKTDDTPSDTEFDKISGQIAEDFIRLISAPAPTPAALQWKLERLLADSWPENIVSQAMSDAKRLLESH